MTQLTLLVFILDGSNLGVGAATHDLHEHLVLGAKTLYKHSHKQTNIIIILPDLLRGINVP